MRLIDADALNYRLTTLDRLAKTDKMAALLGRVLFIVSKMPTVGGWISTKDALPEEKESIFIGQTESDIVLCCVRYNNRVSTELGFVSNGKWELLDDFFAENYEVTHWMPMPEPPKEEK